MDFTRRPLKSGPGETNPFNLFNRRETMSARQSFGQPNSRTHYSRPLLDDIPYSNTFRANNYNYGFRSDNEVFHADSKGFDNNVNSIFSNRPLRSLLGDPPSANYGGYDQRIWNDRSNNLPPQQDRFVSGFPSQRDMMRDEAPDSAFLSVAKKAISEAVSNVLAPLIGQNRLINDGNKLVRPLMSEPFDIPGRFTNDFSRDYGPRRELNIKPKPLLSGDLRFNADFGRSKFVQRNRGVKRPNPGVQLPVAKKPDTSGAKNKKRKRKKYRLDVKDYKEHMLNRPWVNEELKQEIEKKFEMLEAAKKEDTPEIWKAYQEQKKLCNELNSTLREAYAAAHPDAEKNEETEKGPNKDEHLDAAKDEGSSAKISADEVEEKINAKVDVVVDEVKDPISEKEGDIDGNNVVGNDN